MYTFMLDSKDEAGMLVRSQNDSLCQHSSECVQRVYSLFWRHPHAVHHMCVGCAAGHLGNMNELMLVSALAGAEMAMRDAGIDIKPGSGVGAAIEYWHSTSKIIPTRETFLA